MAKRFTDTNKYKKPFIRGLQGAYKLLWDYLYHDCDHAGIWIVDFDIAQIYIGNDMQVNKEEALKCFNKDEKRIIEIDNGKKWFIPSFIEFQYGELNSKNRAHNSVISILKKYDLWETDNKGLISPLQGCKDKDMDKDILIIINNIMSYFNFSEMKNPDKLRQINLFLNILKTQNKLDYFLEQFEGYKKYKEESGEKKHSFTSFIGTIENKFMDGGWNARNWIKENPNPEKKYKKPPIRGLSR